jgi:hypothetical protein
VIDKVAADVERVIRDLDDDASIPGVEVRTW